jgi:hypothetical protein
MATQNPLTPSQIDKLLDLFRVALRKVNPFSDEAQDLIEHHWDEVKTEVYTAVANALSRVLERTRNTVICNAHCFRTRSPEEMINALNRYFPEKFNRDLSILKNIPRGEGDEVAVQFFKLDRWVSDDLLALEYQKRGLTPDPYAQAAVNEANPDFAIKYKNGTQWKDKHGNWCRIIFYGGGGQSDSSVRVIYSGNAGWDNGWWIGGVRLSAQTAGKSRSFKDRFLGS